MSRKGRILIVDDLEKWRVELVETLQRAGFHAESASNTNEALARLNETFYHLLVLDIRMVEGDPNNIEGITQLLQELVKRGLGEATKVMMLSAYGTLEYMRKTFRDFKVVDFLDKNEFDNQVFLTDVRHLFAEKMNINLELGFHWPQGSRSEQFVLNLEVDDARVSPGTPLQSRLAAELEDLLCRLFYKAKSVLVRPLTPGKSGAGVLRVQPFYAAGGGGHEVVVKFGEAEKIEKEYYNFKEYVQPFLGGWRNTTVLDLRRTPNLGGIIYSLLGASNDQLVDFGDFYSHASVPQIKDALDRLFGDTCAAWYANRGYLQPLDLAEDYQQLIGYEPQQLEQVLFQQIRSVRGKKKLHFKNLKGVRTFTNPLLATDGLPFVRPTYVCTTHGDFNQHNLLIDSTGHMWLIDFQSTGQGHILRDVAMLDSTVRFQLLSAEEATLEERLQMEEALCSIDHFSRIEQLATSFSTENSALAKTYATVVHVRTWAHRLVEQNPSDDMSEYYIALLYNAMNTIRFTSLPLRQREHAVLSASLLADRLGLSS
jgi:CheY-like chemotaxis protein